MPSWCNLPRLIGLVAGAALAGYFVPFILLGQDAYITIHDNLDGEFVQKLILANNGQAFSFHPADTIPYLMNGVPRFTYPSGFNLTFAPFLLLPPYAAYIANHLAVHLIAFFGMGLLLRRHFCLEPETQLFVPLAALCFAVVPFYTQYGLSVAGQPLLLFAFLNLRRHDARWTDWIIIALFPLYASFVLAGPFLLAALGVLFASDCLRLRAINRPFLLGLALFLAVSLAIESQMILAQFANTTFVSHRMGWDRWNDLDLHSNLRRTVELLLHTQYHTGSFPTAFILMSALGAGVVLFRQRRFDPVIASVVAAIIAICMLAGFYDWIAHFGGAILRPLRYFNASRFYFLLPTLWLLLFACSLRVLFRVKPLVPLAALLMAAQLAATLYSDQELKNNTRLLLGRTSSEPTYRQYFSEPLFARIAAHIGKPRPSYRVVSIGLHPSVSQFNGFYTLDGYQPSYAVSYKDAFRQIIAPELKKSETLQWYFDTWGSRCYVFCAELGQKYLYGKSPPAKLHQLELNTAQLRKLGGAYVLSAVEIEHPEKTGLTFDAKFSDPASFWDIYLYQVR